MSSGPAANSAGVAGLTRTIWISKISRKVMNARPGSELGGAKVQVKRAVGAQLTNLSVSYRHRCALVELVDPAAAAAFVARFAAPNPSLAMQGGVVEVSLAAERFAVEATYDETTDAARQSIAGACIESLVKELEKREAEANRVRRLEASRRHRALIKQLAAQCNDSVRDDICWNFVTTGRCKRGDACRFKHLAADEVGLAQVPVQFRQFTVDESFPAEREGHPEKMKVNAALVAAAAALPDEASRMCLVLDGAGCKSTRSLTEGAARKTAEVVVPNSVTSTYLAIQASRTCRAYHGSLRAFIDDNAAAPRWGAGSAEAQMQHWRPLTRRQFGCMYLDYCSSLYAGHSSLEKSPLEDIAAIFRTGMLDPAGAALVVTLAVADNGPAVDQIESDLREHVAKHAATASLAVVVGERFGFEATLVQFFNVGGAARAGDGGDVNLRSAAS